MSSPNHWEGDVLGRHQIALFLYNLIQSKVDARAQSGEEGALCIAVDGEWGVGKTFFVERWTSELVHMQHPVVRFDAWKNDLADDPLIGFISALNSTLKPWISKLPMVNTAAKTALAKKARNVVKQAGKAIIPLFVTVGSHLGARYIGEEGLDVVKDALDIDSVEDDKSNPSKIPKVSDKAIEKFFEAALKQHENKQAAIEKLVGELEALVEYMKKESAISLPLFVFIDELDRCRPDYAIRLLEGMKHLFNARGVCFIVTTNLNQLSEAIKAVYGNNFNGYGYLKRFFDFEYQLPAAEGLSYAEHLTAKCTLVSMKLETGIYIKNDRYTSAPVSLPVCFDYVARLFDLSLRSQRQILLQAEAAASSLPKDCVIHVFYLLCLTAIAHKNPFAIDAINKGATDFSEVMDGLPYISFIYYSTADGRSNHIPEKTVSLKELLQQYHNWSILKQQSIVKDSSTYSGSYPQILIHRTLNEKSDTDGFTSLKMYSRVVRLAGQVFK